MQRYLLFCLVILSFLSRASHNRSGEITYKRIPPYTAQVGGTTVQVYWYFITMVKYTDDDTHPAGSSGHNEVLDRCSDTLYYGDGSWDISERSNGGPTVCAGCEPCLCPKCGELIIDENGYRVKKNIFYFKHQFPGTGYFLMHTADPNRNVGVENMFSSANQAFYLESLLVINSLTGPNESPVFTVDPIDKACFGKCFSHNPGAYDAEHDSLSYRMSTPKGYGGQTVIGYSDPGSGGGIFKIDERSGLLTWCSPQKTGEYNIAFEVLEWRKNTSGVPQVIGTVLRDMQVVVRGCPNNDPPVIIVPQDTCVEAGAVVHKKIKVLDPNASDIVSLMGFGGAFSANAPTAVLLNTSGNNYEADFSWQTSCDHIAKQPYQTTFKAEDNAGSQKLATYNVYNVRVVPPSVKNVSAIPLGTTMKISWTPSNCNPLSNPLTKFKVYRKEGCDPYIAEPCKTDIPASSGFIYVGETEPTTFDFIDDNNQEGLIVGQNYSYLVIAVYKDGSASFGSDQICAKLKRDIPVITNVDVLSTSVSGSILIKWIRPLTTDGNLDTVALPGPYHFNLKYKIAGVYSTVFSTSADYLYQLETSYTHTNINTTLDSNQYLIEFVAASTITVGSSQKATSVFLSAIPSDRKIDLAWKSKTPWRNYSYTIFRKDPSSSNFTAIGTSNTTSFSDVANIVNKKTYCYYIQTEGEYSDPTIYKPLLNKSQELCATAIDLTPPCTPTLEINADCLKGFLEVRWQNVRPICSDDVVNYILYYKNTIDGVYEKAYEGDTTFYVYDGTSVLSGCYAIQAQDENGNLSVLSPDFCVENCPEFELPNVFSPNKDGANDFFKAVKVRHVKEIDLIIVDRWGNPIYKTNDPYFQWDGINLQSKQAVSESTYFYVCIVYEPRVKGTVKRILKGNVQVVR